MKVGKALALVMRKWQITNYRLSQASGVVETTVGKLVNGQLESTSWDNVEKLANGLEQSDPMARDAFIGALQRLDSAYPYVSLPDDATGLFWDRELPDSIAAVMAVLDKYKLLDQENIKKLKAKLAEDNAKPEVIFPITLEYFIGGQMHQIRRKQGSSAQDA